MQRRTGTEVTIKGIRSTMVTKGATEASVALAADITLADLNSRLNGGTEFQVSELVLVGGYLRMPLADLFTEAA